MLQGDPSERITIPEIFNHIWVRTTNPSQINDMFFYRESQQNHPPPLHIPLSHQNSGFGQGASTSDVVKSVLLNTSAMNNLDLLIPISPNLSKVSVVI